MWTRCCIGRVHVLSGVRRLTETCGKNLRKLYCVAHKTLCNSFLPCYLLPLLWWYGYRPVTKRMATEIMQVDCGWRVLRSRAPFYGGRLWVTMFMVNDTFIWNTATISRYSILALAYSDRFFVTVYNIVWHKCVYMYIHSSYSRLTHFSAFTM